MAERYGRLAKRQTDIGRGRGNILANADFAGKRALTPCPSRVRLTRVCKPGGKNYS